MASQPTAISLQLRHTLEVAGAPSFSLKMDVALPGRGIIGVFGGSGSGKTTLMRCIAGLEKPVDGNLTVNGEVWQGQNTFLPTHKRPLGCVFQEASLLTHLSARQNLTYGMKRAGTMGDTCHYQHVIQLMGIDDILGHYPYQLSGGQRQRVAIARALLIKPRLLLMDEPLASLDSARKQEILPYLERLRQDFNVPIFYVTHSVDEVARLADHLIILDQGKVAASGDMVDVLARTDLPVKLGDEAGVVIETTVAEHDSQWGLARLAFAGGSLWVHDAGDANDRRLRVRILARDVSLALTPHDDTSILNRLQAVVTHIASDDDGAMLMVQLQVGTTCLVARVTHYSAHRLQLTAGKLVWAQVKSVAIVC